MRITLIARTCTPTSLHPNHPNVDTRLPLSGLLNATLASLMERNINLDAQNIPDVFGGDLICVIVHSVPTEERKQLEHERAAAQTDWMSSCSKR